MIIDFKKRNHPSRIKFTLNPAVLWSHASPSQCIGDAWIRRAAGFINCPLVNVEPALVFTQ